MATSPAVRTALRAAEASIRDAVKKMDQDGSRDRPAIVEIEKARATVTKWRKALDAGDWPGRTLDPYRIIED